MKYTSYSKYIPITEEDYHTFKEQQRKELKHGEEELERPNALLPLVAAQKEKIHTLFDSSKSPDTQEQRIAHLTSIINGLKRKVEEKQQHAPSIIKPLVAVEPTRPKLNRREENLLEALGDVWNAKEELVIDGVVVPNSNKNELLKYVSSKWHTKYLHAAPEGGKQMLALLSKNNIPLHMVNNKLHGQVRSTSTPSPNVSLPGPSTIQGLASRVSPVKTRRGQKTNIEAGLDVLKDGKKFGKFMSQK